MKVFKSGISAALGAAILAVTAAPLPANPPAPEVPSKVYYVLDTRVMGTGRKPDAAIVQRMVDTLVMELTGKPGVGAAWKSLIKPTDVVGIKVSSGAGILGGTREAVATAVARGLREAGLPRSQIILWDRNLEDLLVSGYRKDHEDYTLRWVDPMTGYDKKSLVSAPVLGRLIWGDSKFGESGSFRFSDLLATGDQLSNQSFYSKVLSTEVTRVIHIPSATDSYLTGIHGALADMTLSNLDNWRRFVKAPDHGDPYLAEIYNDEMIRGKVVLTILDALIIQYAGGPFGNPNFTVDNGALFASRDPVALDAILLEMVDEVRKASKLPPAKPMAGYIESAATLGLGQSTSSKIQTLRAGVSGLR